MTDFVGKRNFLLDKVSESKYQRRLLRLKVPVSPRATLSSHEARVLCREYLEVSRAQDRQYLLYLQNLIRGMLTQDQSREALVAFLSPLLFLEETKQGPVFGFHFVLIGLRHPNCPTDLLSRACHHPVEFYAWAAAQHPNCPDADAVWAWGRHERKTSGGDGS